LILADRLLDGERSGRPRTASGIIDRLIEEIIELDPREFGYRSTVWVATLLVHYVWDFHQIQRFTSERGPLNGCVYGGNGQDTLCRYGLRRGARRKGAKTRAG
jgi:hypothetical protein